jgi:hypothetical protein
MRELWWRLLIMICSIPCAAGASGIVLGVDPGDNPLVIVGKLDGQTTAFAGNVRLTATGGDVKELLMLPSGVKLTGDDSTVIDRSNVTIPSNTSLSTGQPRDIRVTLNNITRPGEYTGSLMFLVPGDTEDKALTIPLKVRIDAKPKVQPVSPNMTFQLALTWNALSQTAATWLLPANAVQEDWIIQLDNQTLTPVDVTDATVVMRGEKTGVALSPTVIDFSKMPQTLPASKVAAIPIKIHRDLLLPDRYQGTFRFKLKGSDDPVTVNADLSLRDGPIWAVVIVLAGIITGRLARGMSTSEAQKQLKFLPLFYQLDASAQRVQNADARSYLTGLIQEAKAKIGSAADTDEALSQLLDKLKGRIDLLAGLETLEAHLKELHADALSEELEPKISAARHELIAENVKQAEALQQEVEDRLRKAQEDGTMGRASDLFENVLGAFRAAGARWHQAETVAAPAQPGGTRWAWLAKVMATLSGSEAEVAGAELRFWLVRPLLFLILLVGLALLGLQTLYVNAGSTFGSAGLYDYLGLFLWGLSADVAQRTLQNLQVPKQT